jgi:ribonuclease HI
VSIKVYTDGACSGNPGPGGWGAVIIFDKNKKPQFMSGYAPDTTNNRMELLAAIRALDLILCMGYANVEVYSDSAYLVNAVNKGWIKNWILSNWKTSLGLEVKNRDLWEVLIKLVKKGNVSFIKVQGHSGNEYNEHADQLARREIELNAS